MYEKRSMYNIFPQRLKTHHVIGVIIEAISYTLISWSCFSWLRKSNVYVVIECIIHDFQFQSFSWLRKSNVYIVIECVINDFQFQKYVRVIQKEHVN